MPSGQSGALDYDDVGNLITDTYTETDPNKRGAMLYDAENHMTSAINLSHQYRYNADGKRVKRSVTGSGEFWMVYGLGGELVAEYNATSGIPAQTSPSKEFGYRGGQMLIVAEGANVKWLIQDHLGSTRMEIGLAGNIGDVMRHDYFPFGEEIAGALRSATYGYGGATNTKQKFTGYERDDETGLDYAQARYMSSKQGRFTSVDPDGIGAAVSEPQSWNGYAYVGNRPTTLTDPSGMIWLAHRNDKGDIDGYKWLDIWAKDYQEGYKKAVQEGWEIAAGQDGLSTITYDADCSGGDCSGAKTGKYVLEPDGTHHWRDPNGAQTLIEPMAAVVGLSGIVRSAVATAWEGIAVRTAAQFAVKTEVTVIGDEVAVTNATSLTKVTSWADDGITLDLNPGRWVQLGDATKINYWKTGLPGPKAYLEKEFPFIRLEASKAPFTNSLTREVPTSSLQWPRGVEKWKGIFGQRQIKD